MRVADLPYIMIQCLLATILIECTVAFILKYRKKDLLNVNGKDISTLFQMGVLWE